MNMHCLDQSNYDSSQRHTEFALIVGTLYHDVEQALNKDVTLHFNGKVYAFPQVYTPKEDKKQRKLKLKVAKILVDDYVGMQVQVAYNKKNCILEEHDECQCIWSTYSHIVNDLLGRVDKDSYDKRHKIKLLLAKGGDTCFPYNHLSSDEEKEDCLMRDFGIEPGKTVLIPQCTLCDPKYETVIAE